VFPGTKLRALAEAAGMAIDSEGRFVRRDDDGNVLYLLTNHESAGFSVDSMKTMSTHGVTFLLDVPRVSHGDRVFNQMLDLARRFAEALHGSLVDDNRRPLSEGALEPIRRQVAQYQGAMAARSLPAGGPLALRLFS
jgi:FtsZ-interacting cell division protein ZipA